MQRFYSMRSLQLLHGAALLLLIAFTAIAGFVGLYLTDQASRDARRIGQILEMVEQTRGVLHRQIKEVFDHHFLDDPDAAAEYEAFGNEIDVGLETMQNLADDTEERAAVANLRSAHEAVQAKLDQIMAAPVGTIDPDLQLRIFDTELEDGSLGTIEKSLVAAQELLGIAQARIESRVIRPDGIAFALMVAPILVAALLLLFANAFLRRVFIAPLNELLGTMRAYGSGDLTQRTPIGGARELVILQRTVNQMADELNASREAQLRAEKQAALGALVPIIAHNIRNPLASIRATAQISNAPDLDSETREGLDEILRSVDRLEQWLNSLLTYLHLSPPDTRSANGTLADCADGALRLLGPSLERGQIAVEKSGWVTDAHARLDTGLMEQAVYGLMVNAVEASPTGSRLRLAAGVDGDEVWLRIDDEGPGFEFDPAAHAEFPGRTTKTHGFGLGIPFAQKVCELHGGALSFSLHSGGGTRAEIRLPRNESVEKVA